MQSKKRKLNLKELLIKRTAVRSLVGEATVEKVISHQFEELVNAFGKYKSIEISGLGVFKVSPRKLERKLTADEKMLANLYIALERAESEERKENLHRKIEYTKQSISYLKTKVNEA